MFKFNRIFTSGIFSLAPASEKWGDRWWRHCVIKSFWTALASLPVVMATVWLSFYFGRFPLGSVSFIFLGHYFGIFPPALPPRLIFIGEILLKILCSRPPSPPLPSRLGSPGSFAYLRIRRSISKNPNQVQLILTNRLQPGYHRSYGHD